MTHKARTWRGVGALAAAGAFTIPFAASAQNGAEAPTAVARDNVVQEKWASIAVDGWARANTGRNVQINTTAQEAIIEQDALATADGGDADSEALPASPDSIDPIPVAIADALGGTGGDALAENSATAASNTASGGNSMTTGAAAASNAATVAVTQTQDNSSDDVADASQTGDAPAGGATARATSRVRQTAEAQVEISGSAEANSGGNLQVNDSSQFSAIGQVSTAPADGGHATAGGGGEATSTGGDGGIATASNSAGTASNTASGGNSMTTGAASATNSSSVTITQSSTNSSVTTATSSSDAGSGG